MEPRYVARVFDLVGSPYGVVARTRPSRPAHAYSVDDRDRHALRASIDARKADVMGEVKGEDHALAPMGMEIG